MIDSEWLHQIQVHRLAGLLYHIGAPGSEPITDLMEKEWSRNTAAHLIRVKTIFEIWPRGHAEPFFFKGADFTENLYGDPGARGSADLDVLLPPDGWQDILNCFDQSARRLGGRVTRQGDVHCYHLNDCLFELHRNAAPTPTSLLNFEDIYRRGLTSFIDGDPVRYPCAQDRLYLWLANQSKTSFMDGLWSLVDLALILKQCTPSLSPVALQQLLDQSNSVGLERSLSLALLRLFESSLLSKDFEPMPRLDTKILGKLLIKRDTPVVVASAWRRQLLKLWLCPPGQRMNMLSQMLAKAFRL